MTQTSFIGDMRQGNQRRRNGAKQRPNHRHGLQHARQHRQHQGIRQADEQIGNQCHEADDQAQDGLSGNVEANLSLHGRNQFVHALALGLGHQQQQ